MVRGYESVYILRPSLAEETLTAIMEKYKTVAEGQGAEVESINRWDKRILAYDVKSEREGIYVLMNFRSEPQAADELNRLFKIADEVLRHIIVRTDEK